MWIIYNKAKESIMPVSPFFLDKLTANSFCSFFFVNWNMCKGFGWLKGAKNTQCIVQKQLKWRTRNKVCLQGFFKLIWHSAALDDLAVVICSLTTVLLLLYLVMSYDNKMATFMLDFNDDYTDDLVNKYYEITKYYQYLNCNS